MNPMSEIGAAVIMVAVSVAMVVLFLRYKAAASESRMTRMLARAGGDPEAAGRRGAIPQDVRIRCRTCASEDLCERWLAGGVEGDNSFCENARMFRGLSGTGARSAA